MNALTRIVQRVDLKSNIRTAAVAVGIAGIAFTALNPSDAAARAAPESFADLADKLSPAVVNISTAQRVARSEQGNRPPEFQFPPGSPFEEFFKEFFDRNQPKRNGPSRRRATSLGSGFVIESDGLVVTNNHVIKDADEITVRMADGRRFDAEVVGKDPKTDIALLKIKQKVNLPAVKFGNSDGLRVGDWVLAIGNPFGLGNSVTAGIVSARGRDIQMGSYDDFIQTDASINRGNSGGPLFNMDGQVIGINTAIYSPSGGSVGIGFAIPSTQAMNVIEQLREHGRTRRGWLGVSIQTVTDEIAEGLGMKDAQGALVIGLVDDGPAKKGGLAQGDVIVEFDGKPIDSMRALPRIVANTSIGKQVKVKVWRKGETKEYNVTLGELEKAEKQLAKADAGGGKTEKLPKIDALGMTIESLSDELRQKFEMGKDEVGVVVTAVESDSAAAEKGIRAGDVIVEVSQTEVASPDDVRKEIKKVKDSNRNTVLLLLKRAGDLRFVAVRLGDG